MLEGVLATVLNRFLSAYVDNLNTSQLNVGIWSGDVKLKNLRLKRSALDKFRLPIDVKEGYLGQLTLYIPWSNLKGKPVRVLVENVSLLAAPRDASADVNEDEEEERAQEAKRAKLEQAEFLSQGLTKPDEDAKQTESFISSLVTKIVDNVQITVRNIHVRYEDALSNPEYPFSIGLTLAELSAVSTDENWEPTFVHNSTYGIHKLARLDSLAMYWNTNTEFLSSSNPDELQAKLNALIPTSEQAPEHQYILEPVSGAGKLVVRHQATKDQPAMDATLAFDQIGFTLDDEQYRDGICIMDLFHLYNRQAQYHRFRPSEKALEANRPRALFQFAIRAIVNEMHQKRRVWSWDYLKERSAQRREYIRLFTLVESTGADDTSEPHKALRLLERSLDYKDIRFYRSIARREMRKDHMDKANAEAKENEARETEDTASTTEAAAPAPAPAPAQGGWFSWVWGNSETKDQAKSSDTALNTEQRKELYDAIEWDGTTGTSLLSQDDFPPDVVKMHVTAKLNRGFFHLRDHTSKNNILSLVFDTLQGEVNQRLNNFDVSVSLGTLCVMDGTSANSQYAQIVHVKGEDQATDAVEDRVEATSDPEHPFFFVQYEHNPLDGRADNALKMTMRSMEIVYHRSYVESVVRFFKPPETELELLGALLDIASETLEGIRKETRLGLENALEKHKTLDVSLDIQAPIIVLPEDVTTRDSQHIVLDAGHLAVRSLLADPQTLQEVRAKQHKQYTANDYRQLEELMYDRYFIKLEAAQVVLGEGYQACMASIQKDTEDREHHLLERINLSFTLHNSILPRAPSLTKCKLTGHLPKLTIHFSDRKYHALMRIIDVSIPHFGSPSPPPASAHFDLVQARRQQFAEQLRGADDTLVDELDGSTDSGSDSGSDSAPDVVDSLFPVSPTQAPARLGASQRTFEFGLVVDRVQGTISKSSYDAAQADQLLVEAVFEHFRLGVAVLPHSLEVDVHLGSLDLVDKIVQQASMFQHMITSRGLPSHKDGKQSEGNDRDLVIVRYIQVDADAPDFLETHEGIDQTVHVDISTINFMLTPITVLAVYDWIMLTFVPKDDTPPAPSPTKEEAQEEVQKKLRIKVKLSSIQLRLNADGTLLSTLTLSTADIAVLLRQGTVRVAAKLGTLSLHDEQEKERADPHFASLLSLDGDELADFALETFDASDPAYPGYDTSIRLRCGSLKLVVADEPVAELVAFFSRFAQIKALYDSSASSAPEPAKPAAKVQYDILVKSPVVVLPMALAEPDRLTANLGEWYVQNTFAAVDGRVEMKLDAGLKEIRLVSHILTDDEMHELRMLDDVHVDIQVTEKDPGAAPAKDATKAAPARTKAPDQPTTDKAQDQDATGAVLDQGASPEQDTIPDVCLRHVEFSGSVSDIQLTLTQRQYLLILALSRAFPQLLDSLKQDETLDSDAPAPLALENAEENAKAVDRVQAAAAVPAVAIPTLVHGHFVVHDLHLNLFDDTVVSTETLDGGRLFQFALHEAVLKVHQHPATGLETEVSLQTFSATDTRPGRDTHFREIIPPVSHKGKQLLVNYTVSPAPDSHALAVVTLDSPKFIFSLSPLFALVQFVTSGVEAPEADPAAAPAAAAAPPAPAAAQSSLSFRVNIVEPRIILLSNPERADSEAIVLSVRQIVLSQQTVLILTVTQMGIFVWRMNAPKDRQRLLNDVDLLVSIDSHKTPLGPVTSIDADVEPLLVRLTRSDIQLISSVAENAIALSSQAHEDAGAVVPSTPPPAAALKPAADAQPASDEDEGTDAKLLATREELVVHVAGVQVMLISEVHMLPILDFRLNHFDVSVLDWSAETRVETTLNLWLNNFNLSTSYWEPLLEPWTLKASFERHANSTCSTFTLSSQKRLEVNVSATMLETTNNMMQLLDSDNDLQEEMRHHAPFSIRNCTGSRLSVWSEHDHGSTGGARPGVQRIENGGKIPWAFSDFKSLREDPLEVVYNRLAVHLDDTPWERVRHINVDREGETVLVLRPKQNQVSHRLLCDVKLVNNVKVITFRSTFRIDNRAMIPIEVGIVNDDGAVGGTILRITPGGDSALPISDAYFKKVRVRPDPGFGYGWSTEVVGWQDLMASASHKFVCPAQTHGEAPFLFQSYATRDLKSASQRNYPKLALSLRAPVEVENLLPYDVQYRLFDKNLNHNWSSFLRKGGVSPVHVVQLEHLLLLSIELENPTFSPSEFAIIASDNPDDFQVEKVLQLADQAGQKLELRLHYATYPDSGGAFKVQIYAPYIFLNQSQLPVAVKARPWAGHTRMLAGQAVGKHGEPIGTDKCEPLLLSRFQERRNRFVVRAGDSAWSKALSFDVIGSEVEVTIQSARGDREAHLGLNVEDGLGKFKLSKVIKLTPRYMIHNHLDEAIQVCEADEGSGMSIEPGALEPMHWFHVNSTRQAQLQYVAGGGGWTSPFSLDNIGNVYMRTMKHGMPQHLLLVEIQMNGSVIFIEIRKAEGPWPFLLRNETDDTITFSQTAFADDHPRGRRSEADRQEASRKRYVLKPHSKMKYAWDQPADTDRYIRLVINGRERVVNILEIGSQLPFRFPNANGKGTKVVSLDVRADDAQTLVISDYKESQSNFKLTRSQRSDQRDAGFEAVDLDTTTLFAFKVELEGVGISLISSKVKEIAYCTFRGLELSYTETEMTTAVNVICKWIQIDNQMYGSIFPIVLYPSVVPKDGKELDVHPTLQASVIRLKAKSHGVQHIKYASILLQELTTEVDENFLYAVYDFARVTSAHAARSDDDTQYIEYADQIPEPTEAIARQDEVYIEILHLQPVALNISFIATERVDAHETESSRTLFLFILNALTMALGNVNEAPVRLNALVIENVRVSMAVLQQRVAYHYGQELLFQVHRILGSADFLGNPVGLFNNVSSGVADIFYEPYYGLVMHGNRELGIGLARGASNFVKKTVFGVSDSVSKLTGSISKGLAAVTMDKEFQQRWRVTHMRNKPKHALYGITTGANSLFTSVASGIEGLALRPLEGAEQNGASGFVQGIGRGLVGAFTKPAAGLFDLASNVTEGLRNTTLVFEQNDIDRVRLPRYIASDHIIRPYSEREALGQMWLQNLDQGRVVTDHYIAHVDTTGPHGGSTIMLTENRILYIRTAKLKVLWEVVWPDLSTISYVLLLT